MRKGAMDIGALIAIVALIAVIMLWSDVKDTQAQMAAAVQAQPIGGLTVYPTGTTCPDTLQTIVGVYGVESILTTTNQEVGVANGRCLIYRNGDSQSYDTIQLVSGAYAFSNTNHELDCGTDTFYMICGNDTTGAGGAYYLDEIVDAETGENWQAKGKNQNVKVVLDAIGTHTMTISNTTNFGLTAVNISLAAGQTNTDSIVRICETGGGVIRNPGVMFDYPVANYSSPEIVGGTVDSLAVRMSGNESAYLVGADEIKNYECIERTVKVIAGTGQGNDFLGIYPITLRGYDTGTYIDNAHVMQATEDLADTDIGAADSTTAIVISPY